MKLNDVLRSLVHFYQTIGMGHTEVMLKGALNSDRHPFVVVPNLSVRATVQQLVGKKARLVTLQDIEAGKLHGASGPMAWEHSALQELFRRTLSRITELEAEVKMLDGQVNCLEADCALAEERLFNLLRETGRS